MCCKRLFLPRSNCGRELSLSGDEFLGADLPFRSVKDQFSMIPSDPISTIVTAPMMRIARVQSGEKAIQGSEELKRIGLATAQHLHWDLSARLSQDKDNDNDNVPILILLCPELNWAFLQSLYSRNEAFTTRDLWGTLTTLYGPASNATAISFLPAQALEPNESAIDAFVDEILGGTTDSEVDASSLASRNGILRLTPERVAWFKHIGETNPLLRPSSQVDLERIPVVGCDETSLRILVVQRSGDASQAHSRIVRPWSAVFGSHTAMPSPLRKSTIPLHIYGAFLLSISGAVLRDPTSNPEQEHERVKHQERSCGTPHRMELWSDNKQIGIPSIQNPQIILDRLGAA